MDTTGRFWWAFVIASVLAIVGGISWVFVVGPLEQITWSPGGNVRRRRAMVVPLESIVESKPLLKVRAE